MRIGYKFMGAESIQEGPLGKFYCRYLEKLTIYAKLSPGAKFPIPLILKSSISANCWFMPLRG
jgi:hypothetical protein